MRKAAAFFFLYMVAGASRAAFKDPGFGARPAGMGEAFTAVADDANALLYNPAGAARRTASGVLFSHVKPFTGVDDEQPSFNYFAGLFPLSSVGTIGVGWTAAAGPSFEQTALTLSGATSLNRWWPDLEPTVDAGVNVRRLRQVFQVDDLTAGDSVFAGGAAKSALAVDLGLWMKPEPVRWPGLSLGLSGKSLNQPDLGLAAADKVLREYAGGAAWDFGKALLSADLVGRGGKTEWRAGCEAWFRDRTAALRAGLQASSAALGFSTVLKTRGDARFILDYAYTFPLAARDLGGSHRASFGIDF